MIEPGDVVQYGYSSSDIKLHDYINTTNYSYVVYYNMRKKK